MKRRLATTLVVVAALTVATLSAATTTTRPAQAASTIPVKGCPEDATKLPPCNGDDAVLRWNEQLLSSIRANPGGTGPTITAREEAQAHA